MPRPRNTIRSVNVHLMLPETLVSRIYAVLMSGVEGRIPQGAQQRFFTLAAENLLKEMEPPNA